MRPITFTCKEIIPLPATEICREIATVSRWSEFKGYGFLPGIANAHYDHKTGDMLGSRIRVQNTDGSSHIEEICEWQPGKKVVMKLHHFSPPLDRLASHFIEEWNFRYRTWAQFVILLTGTGHKLMPCGVYISSERSNRRISYFLFYDCSSI